MTDYLGICRYWCISGMVLVLGISDISGRKSLQTTFRTYVYNTDITCCAVVASHEKVFLSDLTGVRNR